MFKKIVALIFVLSLFFVDITPALAQPDLGMENFAADLGLNAANDSDPRDMIVTVVRYFMTFLGIIAVVVILYGGFMWMTAAGNDDKVAKAKTMIIGGAIGLIIVLASFAIVTFVVDMTGNALSGDGL